MARGKKNKRSQKSIKVIIPVEALKKFVRWLRKTFIDHGGKLSLGILLLLVVVFGTRVGCQYDQKNGFQCKAGYIPPDPQKVKEAVKK